MSDEYDDGGYWENHAMTLEDIFLREFLKNFREFFLEESAKILIEC